MDHLARTPLQIGTLIRRVRKKHGWNQGELADKAGLRQATVSLIETGHGAAKLDTLLRVLAALDLELKISARRKSSPADIEELL
ncbi:helix-turn-helix domain-containing protein [Pyruvatibacter mobilis]|uniref:helix-turn-helix domain-containing protein n=1 Tax=Pyruvatibacter mobilis TaxID=1712261 RepID=UPI003C7CDA83